MKKKTSATENKSQAAKQLGGQPENDQDARLAGVESATAPDSSEPKAQRGKRGTRAAPSGSRGPFARLRMKD